MLQYFARKLNELHEVKREERGFTLIELLVVIIIIGILAAIAIPVFLEQREKAWAAAAASELRNMAAAATSCSADNDGSYTACDEANLENFGWSNDSEVDETVTLNNDDDWAAETNHVNFTGCVYVFTTEQADADTGKVVQQDPANC